MLMWGLGGAGMAGSCGSNEPGPPGPGVTQPETPTDTPTPCSESMDDSFMRYHIPLVGNPSSDVALRNKYIAAFGSACYMSEVTTFDCFYQKWQSACADAVKIAEVSGIAPYDKGYTCQPAGNGDYTLQVGPDVANKLTINYQAAPRQTPLTEINGSPTAVNGPYRNLPEPQEIGPGNLFDRPSGMVDANGGSLIQRKWILQVTATRTAARFTPICRASCGLVRIRTAA